MCFEYLLAEHESLRARLEAAQKDNARLAGLCHRWNKMAGHVAAGSEYCDDPERVLEALEFQRKMQQRLRDKNRERAEAAERELAAEKRQNRRLRKALKDIQACPDGKSKSWPEIDAIIRAALNPTGDAMISGVWQ